MTAMKFVMVGGFLGAGKTTAIARLARWYMGRGQKVGLVTNDQAQGLVDTASLRAQGFPVTEVAGACFCCRFDDLIARSEELAAAARPDVILAEPVGSCTDLVATVIQPLKHLHQGRFEVAPYAVLFKPSHGLKILKNEPGSGFSPKAAYIFHKQLEEADAIVLNRIDELAPGEVAELRELVEKSFPGRPVLAASARTGEGFEAVCEFVSQPGNFGRRLLDIDYDIYAKGEAELGWLNSSLRISAMQPFDLDELLVGLVRALHEELAKQRAEVAHLKLIGLGPQSFGVANLVSSQTGPELSLASHERTTEADLTVNARVAADPAWLATVVRDTIERESKARDLQVTFGVGESLRPGRPVPTYRHATAI